MTKGTTHKRSPRLSKEVRISSILAAAREVFEEAGYENAKIADIAKRIGVVEGTVFHYFGSKKMLVVKLIENFYERITQEIEDGLQGIEGTHNRLYYLIRFHLKTITVDSRLCGVILRESRGLDQDLANDIQRLNRNYTYPLVEILRAGISNGDVKQNISIATVRNTIYGSIEHTLWDMLSEGGEVDVESEAKELLDLVYPGISTQQALDSLDRNEITSLIRKLNCLLE